MNISLKVVTTTEECSMLYLLSYVNSFQPEPLVCKCQNGGVCVESASAPGMTECRCDTAFVGTFCDVRKEAAGVARSSSAAAVFVPIFLIIVVIISAVALYVYYQRKRGE